MNIFNPEHDLCMANGDANFVPPFSALEFGRDCAGLTSYIQKAGDGEIVPWGWDAVLKQRLVKQGFPVSSLPSDEALDEIRRLSRRGIAADAGAFVNANVPNPLLRPDGFVKEVSSVEDAVSAVEEFSDAVFKAPLSGSGKGLRWARRGELSASDLGWCKNIISRQGSLMVEKRLEVVQDFAMLFHVGPSEDSGNSVNFEGYSLFFNDNGIYKGNVLSDDAQILSELSGYVPETLIVNVKAALTLFLERKFSGRYSGFVGVDMFIYREAGQSSFRLAPVVEINVRMTMGLLANRVYRRLGRDFGDGRYVMTVEFSSREGELYSRRSSYLLALTKITPSTKYAVVVKER